MLGQRLGKVAAVMVLIAPLAAAVGFAIAGAQTPLTITMTPTKGVEPNLSGQATITPLGNNQFRVDITVNGLKANDDRAAHIHSPGTDTSDPAGCDTGGPVVYPLNDVKADANGKGTSTTTITIDPSMGTPGPGWYVNVHSGPGSSPGAGVICGKINTSLASLAGGTSAAGTSSQSASGSAQALPATGVAGPAPSHTDLIAALALTAIALGGAGVVLARRR